MKKFTVLLVFVACASFVFAQSTMKDTKYNYKVSKEKVDLKTNHGGQKLIKINLNDAKAAAWIEDFDENDQGNLITRHNPSSPISWVVGNSENFLASPGAGQWISDATRELAFKGGNAAFLDPLQELPDYGGTGPTAINTSISFQADLTALTGAPKVSFFQLVRTLNREKTYFEWIVGNNTSDDWTTAMNSNSINSITLNGLLPGDTWGDTLYSVLIPEASGQTISFRFRWEQEDNGAQHGYVWVIDNITIEEAPEYDLAINDFRVNFFSFMDYHLGERVDSDNGTNYAFNSSGHYGQIPKSFAKGGAAVIGFSACTENVGGEDVMADIKVTVVNSSNVVLYEKTMPGANINISNTLGDTLDIWGINDAWTIPEDIDTGKYFVNFEVIARDQEDANPDNNIGQAIFCITENVLARNVKDNGYTHTFSPNNVSLPDNSHPSALRFDYDMLNTQNISSMQFYVTNQSDGGNIAIDVYKGNPSSTELQRITGYDYSFNISDTATFVKVPFEEILKFETAPDADLQKPTSALTIVFSYEFPDDETHLWIAADNSQKFGWYQSLIYWDTWYLDDFGNALIEFTTFDILNQEPAPEAIEVEVNADIFVEFSDSIPFNNSEFFGNAKVVRVSNGSEVSGVRVAAVDSDPRKLQVIHDDLAESTQYRVEIPNPIIKGYDAISWTFTTKDGVSTPNSSIANLEIFPNPTSGILNINNVKGATIEVINIVGQVVEKIDAANDYNTIDISGYSSGNYFVKVIDGDNVDVKKINLTK